MGRILSLSCFMGNAGSQYSFHILPYIAWREREADHSINHPFLNGLMIAYTKVDHLPFIVRLHQMVLILNRPPGIVHPPKQHPSAV